MLPTGTEADADRCTRYNRASSDQEPAMELTGTLQRIKDLQRRFESLRGYL